jgi:plastocyanin
MVAAALALGACGDDENEPDPPAVGGTATEETSKPSGGASQTVRVSETDFELDPKSPRVRKPGTVKFVARNDGQTVHALEVEGPGGEAETKEIQPGQSAELSIDLSEAGTFTMYCPVGNHREMGMEGKVSVLGRGAGGAGPQETETEEETETEDEGGGSGGGGYGY